MAFFLTTVLFIISIATVIFPITPAFGQDAASIATKSCQWLTVLRGAVLLIGVVVAVFVAVASVLPPRAAHTVAAAVERTIPAVALGAVCLVGPVPAVLPVVAPLVHGDAAPVPAVELPLGASRRCSRRRARRRLAALGLGTALLLVGAVPAVVRAVALLFDLHAPPVAAGERVGLALFRFALRLVVSVSAVVLAVTLPVLPDALAVAAVEGPQAALGGLAVLLVRAVAAVVHALAAVDQLPHALAVAAAERPGLAVRRLAVRLVLLVLAVGPEVAALLLRDAAPVAAVEGPGGAGPGAGGGGRASGARRGCSGAGPAPRLLRQLHRGQQHQDAELRGGPHRRRVLRVGIRRG